MEITSFAVGLCNRLVRLGSLAISLVGLWTFSWADFRSNTVVIGLFAALPLLSFPAALLFYRRVLASAVAQWALAIGFLTSFSMLNWRTCSSFGYCQSVAQTVGVTLNTWRVEGMFLIATAATVLVWLERRNGA